MPDDYFLEFLSPTRIETLGCFRSHNCVMLPREPIQRTRELAILPVSCEQVINCSPQTVLRRQPRRFMGQRLVEQQNHERLGNPCRGPHGI